MSTVKGSGRRQRHRLAPPPPTSLVPWLEDTGSLTERMRATCGVDFKLHVLAQKFDRPLNLESRVLNLPPRRRTLVREVLLCRQDTPWIFARSVLPIPVLRGSIRRVTHLGKRPLGDILFSSPDWRRRTLSISALEPGSPLNHRCTIALKRDPLEAWLRQSLFEVHNGILLVSEIFLPEIGTE